MKKVNKKFFVLFVLVLVISIKGCSPINRDNEESVTILQGQYYLTIRDGETSDSIIIKLNLLTTSKIDEDSLKVRTLEGENEISYSFRQMDIIGDSFLYEIYLHEKSDNFNFVESEEPIQYFPSYIININDVKHEFTLNNLYLLFIDTEEINEWFEKNQIKYLSGMMSLKIIDVEGKLVVSELFQNKNRSQTLEILGGGLINDKIHEFSFLVDGYEVNNVVQIEYNQEFTLTYLFDFEELHVLDNPFGTLITYVDYRIGDYTYREYSTTSYTYQYSDQDIIDAWRTD